MTHHLTINALGLFFRADNFCATVNGFQNEIDKARELLNSTPYDDLNADLKHIRTRLNHLTDTELMAMAEYKLK